MNKIEIEIYQKDEAYGVWLLVNGKVVRTYFPLDSLALARLQANDVAQKVAAFEEKLLLTTDDPPRSSSEIPGWLR